MKEYIGVKMLSLVVPVLNEEKSIEPFIERVQPILNGIGIEWEILFVDDGSQDLTAEKIKSINSSNPRIKLAKLSRNFGKEAALTAGLELSAGDAVVPMDVDLQDPPEILSDFVEKWRQGFDIVYGQRVARSADTFSKKMTAGWFYKFFNSVSATPIEPNVGDYRLMSRRVVDATLQLRERNRFMKGIFAWVGFPAIGVPYERPAREVGDSKFNFWKLWNFAIDGITGFSTAPLRVWTYVGGIIAFGAIAYMLITILKTAIFGVNVPGYASLMTTILLLGAVQLISLGILGEYIGRMYHEVKKRPIYILAEEVGCKPNKRSPGGRNA
jgi:glycosyltransferase involved in cell wall biosynthesis